LFIFGEHNPRKQVLPAAKLSNLSWMWATIFGECFRYTFLFLPFSVYYFIKKSN